jgi:hypothetical protein
MRGHNKVEHFYMCFNGKIFENLFEETTEPKKVQIYLQGDLMVIKKKVTLYVFICEILANMTQVSNVAPGPLVFFFLVFFF